MSSLAIFFSQDELDLKVPGSARIEIRKWTHCEQVDYVLEIVIMGEDGKPSFTHKDALNVSDESEVFAKAEMHIASLQQAIVQVETLTGVLVPFNNYKGEGYDKVNDLRE